MDGRDIFILLQEFESKGSIPSLFLMHCANFQNANKAFLLLNIVSWMAVFPRETFQLECACGYHLGNHWA